MRVHMCVYVCIRHARSPLGRERSLQLRKLVVLPCLCLGPLITCLIEPETPQQVFLLRKYIRSSQCGCFSSDFEIRHGYYRKI